MYYLYGDSLVETGDYCSYSLSYSFGSTNNKMILASQQDGGKTGDDSDDEFTCDDVSNTVALFKQLYNLIKYLIPVIIIILSIIDFIKVVASGDDKEYKNAWNKLVKRIIIGIVILIVPQLLEFLLSLSGVLGKAGKGIFCILS